MKIGISTSVAKAHNFSALETITYAALHQFDTVQIYMDEAIAKNREYLNQIKGEAQARRVSLSCHLPSACMKAEMLDVATRLLDGQRAAIVVFHHDPKRFPTSHELERFIRQGQERNLQMYVENYFVPTQQKTNLRHAETYFACFAPGCEPGVRPALDISRFYDSRCFDAQQGHHALMHGLMQLAALPNAMLHLIDATSPDMERNAWCPIGQGIIPYAEIFGAIKQWEIDINSAIFEYEDQVLPLESRNFVRDQLG